MASTLRNRSRPRPTTTARTRAAAAPPVVRLTTVARCDADGRVWLAGGQAPALLLAGAAPLAAGMRVLAQEVDGHSVVLGRVDDRQAGPGDGRLELSAAREVVLRSGAASLTLTAAGKAILAGEYVLTRAKGVNKIKGGSVQIN